MKRSWDDAKYTKLLTKNVLFDFFFFDQRLNLLKHHWTYVFKNRLTEKTEYL